MKYLFIFLLLLLSGCVEKKQEFFFRDPVLVSEQGKFKMSKELENFTVKGKRYAVEAEGVWIVNGMSGVYFTLYSLKEGYLDRVEGYGYFKDDYFICPDLGSKLDYKKAKKWKVPEKYITKYKE